MRAGRAGSLAFAGPALLLVALYLVYPLVDTIWLSFRNGNSSAFVGLANYVHVFTSSAARGAIVNNVLWLVVFTCVTVGAGLLLAVLLDGVRHESAAKALVFVPMAISFVGASVIWKFVFAYKPAGAAQIGLLNAIVTAFGGQPIGWLIERPWINNLCLIAVGAWIWTGFCMVIFSAAYKGIPAEYLEAARVDGAGEWQVLRWISLPSLAPTIAVVATTMVINVLKVFDVVYVMTNGNFGTEVLANRMYKDMFQFMQFGRASAIAVILFVAVLPVLVVNVRRLRQGGA